MTLTKWSRTDVLINKNFDNGEVIVGERLSNGEVPVG